MINGYIRDTTPFSESVLDQSPVNCCSIIIGFLTFYSNKNLLHPLSENLKKDNFAIG